MDLVKLETEIRKHNESFCSDIRGMTVAQLKDVIARESVAAQEIARAKENDEELQDLRREAREAAKPYNDSIKKQRQKIDFAVAIIEEKTIEGVTTNEG